MFCAIALLLFAFYFFQNYNSNNSNCDKQSKLSDGEGLASNDLARQDPAIDAIEEVPAARPRPRLVTPLEEEKPKSKKRDYELRDDFDLFREFPYLEHLRRNKV